MARKIVWTRLAHSQKLEILAYWKVKTGSVNYSKKLDALVNKNLTLISKFPYLGVRTQIRNIRAKVVAKNYLIVYKFTTSTIFVFLIWDTRKNPDDLNRLVRLHK